MPYLEENEWMILNELAYNISYIYSMDDMRKDVLSWLNLLIKFDGAVFSLVDSARNTLKNSIGYNISEDYVRIYEKEYIKKSPISWIIRSGNPAACKESDSLSFEAIHTGDFYKIFYSPNKFQYCVCMNIVFREDVVGLISIYKKYEKGDFFARDLFILNQLQKHLAYRLYYESKKGDTRYFYAKGYHEKICREFGLTSRESELLNYAVKGLSNEDIAETMKISIHTVKKHFHSLYIKMNVKNRVQLLQSLPLSTDKINFDVIK